MSAEKRIPELDGLRGCAILLVTIWHSVMLIDPSKSAINYLIWRFYAWSLRSAVAHQMLYYVGHFYLALLYGLVLILATRSEDGTKSILRSRVLGFFGLVSYSLYLFYSPAKGLVFHLFQGTAERLQTMSDVMLMALSAAVTIVYCLWLYWIVERPARLLGKTFGYGSNTEAPGAVAIQRRMTS